MNIAYLIGNGFDLMLGMKTRPSDFLQAFINSNSTKLDDPASKLAETIRNDGVDTWSDFEMKLGDYSSKFSPAREGDVDEYLMEVDALESYLATWLKKEQDKIDDAALQNRSHTFFASITNIVPFLAEQGIRFSSEDSVRNCDFICFNYTDTFTRLYNTMCLDESLDSFGARITLQSLISPHGQLNNFIVCGVDGTDQITNADMRNDDKVLSCIVKEQMQRNSSFNFYRDAQTTIYQANLICIFGMSLGKSDRRWWKQIADSLLHRSIDHPAAHVVIFSYDINEQSLLTPLSRYVAQSTVRDSFFRAAEMDQNLSERIANMIHVFPSKMIVDK